MAVTLPLAVAVALVSIFTQPGGNVLVQIGPLEATLEGLDFAAQVVLRLFVTAAALTLFGMTTAPRAFIVDLERRRFSPRLAFAVGALLETVPLVIARARTVRDAQRARGLYTEGGFLRRVAAIVPLVGPVVIGSLHQVEARSLALDARAFGRPGPRHMLWVPHDSAFERLARWLLILGLAAIAAGVSVGLLPGLP